MKKMDLYYLDYCVPGQGVPVEDFVREIAPADVPKSFRDKDDFAMYIQAVLGLEQIKVESEKTREELLGGLLEEMLDKRVVSPEAIGLVIVAEEIRMHTRENIGKYLQHKYGMKNAFVLHVSGNHCANVACAWSLAGQAWAHLDNILIIGAVVTNSPRDRIVGTYGIMSDGAGLMLLTKTPGLCTLVDTVTLSNGMLHEADLTRDYSLLHLKYTSLSIKNLLSRNQLGCGDIRQVIPQNANPMLLTNAIVAAGFDPAKIYLENLGRLGHVDCVDLIANLKDVISLPDLRKNDLILAFNMGWAGSYVSSLINVN